MQGFRYEAPETLDAVLATLARERRDAQVLAGGTDLLVQMQGSQKPERPRTLVDLKRVAELRRISLDESGLCIGAAVSCAELVEHPQARSHYPGLVEAAELIGSVQIQNRATLGGNLCNGSPAADTTPALLALDARALVAGSRGRRELAVKDLLKSPGQTALADDELLIQLQLPPAAPGSADAYLRFTPRAEMDIAVAGAGVWLRLDEDGRCRDARVALGAVAPTALLVPQAAERLMGSALESAVLGEAAALCEAAANPIDDARGTIRFRKRIARVLFTRATRIAAERATR